jgi:hypothetical protein
MKINIKITKLYIFLIAALIIFLSSNAYLVKDSASLNKNTVTKVFSNVNNEAVRYDNSKIIKFDHKLHVTDAAVKCQDCHTAQ